MGFFKKCATSYCNLREEKNAEITRIRASAGDFSDVREKNAEITRIRASAGDFSDVRAMLEKMLDTINRSGQK